MVYLQAATRRNQLIAAARRAFARDGVARTPLRTVASEAGVPLGTMQYIFPSKELLLRAVIEDVVEEIAEVLRDSAESDQGLEHAIRRGIGAFWSELVTNRTDLQLMQYELTTYALRTPGQEQLARRQYERYGSVVAEWCEHAATLAGETCAVSFAQLARVMVAGIDGLILQHVCDPDEVRSREDLEALITMLISLAGIRTNLEIKPGRSYS